MADSSETTKKTSLWADTKHVFRVCTKGYEAKVINVVGYSILQVVLDLTVLQLMARFAILSYNNDLEGVNLDHEIEPTADRLTTLALFFATTSLGAVVAVYRHAIGAALLILTQIAMSLGSFNLISKPMILSTLEEFWTEKDNYSFETNFMLGFYHCFITLVYCMVFFFPTFLGIWFIYCTFIVMLVLMGFKIFDVQETNFLPLVASPTSATSSTLSSSDQSTPAETDYFSDSSSI